GIPGLVARALGQHATRLLVGAGLGTFRGGAAGEGTRDRFPRPHLHLRMAVSTGRNRATGAVRRPPNPAVRAARGGLPGSPCCGLARHHPRGHAARLAYSAAHLAITGPVLRAASRVAAPYL